MGESKVYEVEITSDEKSIQICKALLAKGIEVEHVYNIDGNLWEHISPEVIRREIANIYDDEFADSIPAGALKDICRTLKGEVQPMYDDLFNTVMNEYVPNIVETQLKAKGIKIPE